jgi:hypothetical protein
MIKKIEFCAWDGDPALLVTFTDGRIHGYAFTEGRWTQGNAADIAMEAPILTEQNFKKNWPDINLPSILGAEIASSFGTLTVSTLSGRRPEDPQLAEPRCHPTRPPPSRLA